MISRLIRRKVGFLSAKKSDPRFQEALHVAPDAYFFSGDNGVGFTYNLTEPSAFPKCLEG